MTALRSCIALALSGCIAGALKTGVPAGASQSVDEEWCRHVEQSTHTVSEQLRGLRGSYNCKGLAPVKLAVVTILTEAPTLTNLEPHAYIEAARVLGATVRKRLNQSAHLLAFMMEGQNWPNGTRQKLESAGWIVGTVPELHPPHPSSNWRFRNQFTKIMLFNQLEYERVLYADSDTMAVGNLDDLFATDFPPGRFLGVVRDFRNGKWTCDGPPYCETPGTPWGFNMGLALIRPNGGEFARLMNLLFTDAVPYEQTMSEQGFLNAVYHTKDSFVELPFQANVNAAINEDQAFWQEHVIHAPAENRPIMTHFTMVKPWACPLIGEAPFCHYAGTWRQEIMSLMSLDKLKHAK